MDDLLETQGTKPLEYEAIEEVMNDEFARHPEILENHDYGNFTVVKHGLKGHHFLLARHNRAKKDPLRSILKKGDDSAINDDKSVESEESELMEFPRDQRTVFSDESHMKGTDAKAKLGDIRVKYT